jgi:glutathionylspermidine synthase
LDEDVNRWKAAIAKDGLVWKQVSNLKKWDDPIAVQFGIQQIPATILLNSKGEIIAKDLYGDALKAKIKSLLE